MSKNSKSKKQRVRVTDRDGRAFGLCLYFQIHILLSNSHQEEYFVCWLPFKCHYPNSTIFILLNFYLTQNLRHSAYYVI